MKVSSEKNKGIVVSNKEIKILITEDDKYTGDDFDVVITSDYTGKAFHINFPGEYEVKRALILAQSDANTEKITSIEFILDEVVLLFLDPEFIYNKKVHDNFGDINILFLKLDDKKNCKELISKFDPEVIVAYGPGSVAEESLKKAEIENFEKKKDIEFKATEFGEEDFILKAFVLETK